jgi:transketolase
MWRRSRADLTRQTETDIFRDAIPERFINIGMAEANMIGIAGALARAGHTVFINTFGVFCTRRCYDQIAMAVAYPNLNVKIRRPMNSATDQLTGLSH